MYGPCQKELTVWFFGGMVSYISNELYDLYKQ